MKIKNIIAIVFCIILIILFTGCLPNYDEPKANQNNIVRCDRLWENECLVNCHEGIHEDDKWGFVQAQQNTNVRIYCGFMINGEYVQK